MAIQIQLRRGTAAQWTSANPILAQGEFGYESDTTKFKVGNGTASWSALSYAVGGGLGEGTASALFLGINNTANHATTASSINWTGVTGTPTTISGYGITDATTASISNAIINTSLFVAPEERFNIISGSATGTINIDTITSTAWVYTNPGNTNFIVNVRGNASNSLHSILNTGDAITVGLLNRTGTTSSAFFATTVQVDGSTVIPVWNNFSPPPSSTPSQSASGYDSYTYTFIKTASSTYITLGSWTQFR